MRAFLIELAYFLGTLWSNAWRWALRKKRNLGLTVAGLVIGLIVLAIAVQGGNAPSTDSTATPTPTPTEEVRYTEVTAVPAEPGEGVSGQGDEGSDSDKTDEAGETSKPLDRTEPEAVARAWATAYLVRESAEETEWQQQITPYTMPGVVQQLALQAFQPEQILYGKAPTKVTEITVTDAEADAEKNTPVRWSHNLVVAVKGDDGSTTTITFGLVLVESTDGWAVTSVEEIAVK